MITGLRIPLVGAYMKRSDSIHPEDGKIIRFLEEWNECSGALKTFCAIPVCLTCIYTKI